MTSTNDSGQSGLLPALAPITWACGFIERPFRDVAAALARWRASILGGDPYVTSTVLAGDLTSLLRKLEPLMTAPKPRELAITTKSEWTAYFDNGLYGTDVAAIGYLAQLLKCRTLAVECIAPGRYESYKGAVKFELFGPERTHFLNYVRTVSAMHTEGRWYFDISGEQQPYEEPEYYRATRIADRFPPRLLERYCRALGIDLFNPNFYGPDAILVETAQTLAPGAWELGLEAAQKRLGIK